MNMSEPASDSLQAQRDTARAESQTAWQYVAELRHALNVAVDALDTAHAAVSPEDVGTRAECHAARTLARAMLAKKGLP